MADYSNINKESLYIDCDCQNCKNMLPIHCASKYGNEDKLVTLLRISFKTGNPSYINILDANGKTPLDLAKDDDMRLTIQANGGVNSSNLKN